MHTECGSNRTFMELKWVNSPSSSLLISRSNRTFMELKSPQQSPFPMGLASF